MQLFNLGAWALAAKLYVAVGGSYITYTYRSWALSKGPLEDKRASAYRRHLLRPTRARPRHSSACTWLP